MEAIENLPIVGIVKSHYSYQSIKNDICDRLLHIPELHLLKGSVQIVKLVCECIENLVPRGNSKINGLHLDKKQMALDVLEKLFEMTTLEIGVASKAIDFLIESRSIKRISNWKRCRSYLCGFFFNRSPVLDTSTEPTKNN